MPQKLCEALRPAPSSKVQTAELHTSSFRGKVSEKGFQQLANCNSAHLRSLSLRRLVRGDTLHRVGRSCLLCCVPEYTLRIFKPFHFYDTHTTPMSMTCLYHCHGYRMLRAYQTSKKTLLRPGKGSASNAHTIEDWHLKG